VARTAQTVLGQLTRAFHYRDRHIFLRLYIQYVRPHLEFCVPAWSPWLDGDKDCLERVEKRALGMISGLAGRTYEDRLKELGIVALEERRHQMDMLQTFKILSGKEKVDPSSWFTMASDSERVTRQSADRLNIRPGTPRLDIRRYFYSQRVVDSWNSVPHDIKISVCECLQKCLQKPQRCYACTRLIDFLD
jgi:ribonuclease P/MRP protein subunit RPP40